MYLRGAKMPKYYIYVCFGASLLLFSKLKIKLLHKIWRSSSTADPRHYKSRATDIHTPFFTKKKNNFSPFFWSLSLFPCYCCPDTMVVSTRRIQESFCQPAKRQEEWRKKVFRKQRFSSVTVLWGFLLVATWTKERERDRECSMKSTLQASATKRL